LAKGLDHTNAEIVALLQMQLRRSGLSDEDRQRLEKDIAELTGKDRAKPMSMDDIRSNAIRCLHPLAGLSKKDRQRVLRHALKVAAV
jgi:hypothetical protein|tara:strand:- start:9806 stop:10066 length:261 start_codon:yes stop_codon:yes gene_type:complete